MVKITFKTLQQKSFQIECDNNDTILQVKQKITSSQGFPVEQQKIIFSGKILADDKIVQDCAFKDKDFCVVMVSKPKPTPAASTSTSTSTPAPAPAAPAPAPPTTSATEPPSTPLQPSSTTAPIPPNAPGGPTTTTSSSTESPATTTEQVQDDGSGFLVGPALQTSIDEMVAMGFPLEQVKRALRASFNNPHRAVEYLMNGNIPETNPPPPPAVGATPAPAAASTNTAVPATPATPSPAGSGAAASRNLFAQAAAASSAPPPSTTATGGPSPELAMLRNDPLFRQARRLVQQNPGLLQPFLAQLGQSNPEVLALIDRNQAEFVQYLQEGADGDDGDDLMAGGDDDLFGPGGAGGDAGGEGGEQYIQVTEEEKAAIERLVAMGFERNLVIQAYLACERNEELAANYLVEHGWGDDADF
ncbi:UV excision repair protein Rad23 [Meredithblackwellia eburnea MCA 4105]